MANTIPGLGHLKKIPIQSFALAESGGYIGEKRNSFHQESHMIGAQECVYADDLLDGQRGDTGRGTGAITDRGRTISAPFLNRPHHADP